MTLDILSKNRNDLTSEERAKIMIKEFTKSSGLNLSSLSKKVGIDPPTLYNFMSGRTSMTFKTWTKIETFIIDHLNSQL
jgi:predicted transcriptional regulator